MKIEPLPLFLRKQKYILQAAFGGTLSSLIYLLAISRSEKNAWLLGYSKTRGGCL
jgi:hypothetical protein